MKFKFTDSNGQVYSYLLDGQTSYTERYNMKSGNAIPDIMHSKTNVGEDELIRFLSEILHFDAKKKASKNTINWTTVKEAFTYNKLSNVGNEFVDKKDAYDPQYVHVTGDINMVWVQNSGRIINHMVSGMDLTENELFTMHYMKQQMIIIQELCEFYSSPNRQVNKQFFL